MYYDSSTISSLKVISSSMISEEQCSFFGLCKAHWRHTKVRSDGFFLNHLQQSLMCVMKHFTFTFYFNTHSVWERPQLSPYLCLKLSYTSLFSHFIKASHSLGSWECFRATDQLNSKGRKGFASIQQPSWQNSNSLQLLFKMQRQVLSVYWLTTTC